MFIPRILTVFTLLAVTACAGPELENRNHPLTGHIWDSQAGTFIEAETLFDRLAAAEFVMLGERHDNPRHHTLQAQVVVALVARGQRPAVAFEMLTRDKQDAVERARREAPDSPDALAAAVAWSESGWPAWAQYRPVFAAAYAHGLPVVAANLPREQLRPLAMKGAAKLSPEARERYALDVGLPPRQREAMTEALQAGHCGLMPEKMIPGMLTVQRARNGIMAKSLLDAARDADGAVLITGNGHARADRGVPYVLGELAPERPTLALAFREVEGGETDPQAYGAADAADDDNGTAPPFDYVWFTASKVRKKDPCEGLRQHMEDKQGDEAAS